MTTFRFKKGDKVRVIVSYIVGMFGKEGKVELVKLNDFNVEEVSVRFANGDLASWAASELEFV